MSRANGDPDFTKIEATFTRVQPLPANFSLLLAAYGMWTRTPLLAPELCGYGGRVFGRAFDPSELVGDSCLELLGELRYDIAHSFQNVTQLQLMATPTAAGSIILPQFPGHLRTWMVLRLEGDFASVCSLA